MSGQLTAEVLSGPGIDSRPTRRRSIAAEHWHLERLARSFSGTGDDGAHQVVRTALDLCMADAAGISILQPDWSFEWISAEGSLAGMVGTTHPADGPCRATLDAAEPTVFVRPAMRFPDRKQIHPAICEEMHVPLCVTPDVHGTLWVATHEPQRRFCREDVRILSTLAGYAANVLLVTARERLAERLQQSENLFRDLTEHLQDVLWLANTAEQRFLFVSPAAKDVLGITAGEAMRDFSAWFRRIVPEDRERVRQRLSATAPKEAYEIEYRTHLPGGGTRWIHEHGIPTSGSGCLAGISEDVTERKAVEAELRDAHQRLRRQVENSPMGVVEFDKDFRIIFWSPNAERMFGWEAGEVLGRRARDLKWVYEADQTAVDRVADALFRGTSATSVSHNRNYRKDGSLLWCEWYNSVLLDEWGNIKSVLSFVLDATERRRAEEALRQSEERRELAQRSAQMGTFESFFDSGRLVWNETMERLFGLAPGTFEGHVEDWRRRIHPDDRDRIRELVRDHAERHQPDVAYDFRAFLPSGEVRILNTRGRIFYDPDDGHAVRMLGISMDVTEQRQALLDRERLLAEAQREIRLRVAAEAQLRRSNEDLQQFAYSASHDLREPLRTISVYSELMSRRYAGRLDPEADRFLMFIRGASLRMESLLQDLLEYTRIEAPGESGSEICDPGEVAATVVSQLRSAIERNEATVTVKPLPQVAARCVHLQQLFLNLIGNALKYRGPENPVILVSAQPGEAFHTFTVEDNGIGIAEEYQKQIFGIFRRLHTSGSYPGTGIGLAICQKIVERYGGRIWVESRLGEGARFRFTLPVPNLKESDSVY